LENNKIQKKKNQLLLENEELHQRVYELEETLNSIRNGEIDAIVVPGVDGDVLYSLSSVETVYRIIIEEMYEGAITLSKDGLITYCNTRFAELFSEPSEKIVGSHFVDFLHEDDRQRFHELLHEGLVGKSVGEFIYTKKNGYQLNLRLSASALSSDIQNVVCILFSDITELKQQEKELIDLNSSLEQKVAERTAELNKSIDILAVRQLAVTKLSEELIKAKKNLETRNEELVKEVAERKLAKEELLKVVSQVDESEKRLRNYFKLGLLGMAITSVDKKWIEANETICNFLGYTKEELEQKTWAELTHPEDIAIDSNYFDQVMKNEIEGYKIDKRFIRKNGDTVYTELSVRCIRDAENNVKYFVALINDITARKESEAALIESENKFKNLVWDMNVGVLLQGPNSEIFLCNPKALELLGLNEDQLLGKTSLDPDWNVIHEDGSPFPGNTHPVPQSIEKRLPVKGVIMGVYNPGTGERVWLLVDALPQLNNDGTIKQVVCTFINITERKLTETALIESERLLRESQKVANIGSFYWDLITGFWKSSVILDEIFGIDANFNRTLDGWASIVHPDWQKKMTDYVANKVLGKQQNFDKEYQIIRQNDGVERWVHGIAALEFNPDKKPVRLIGTISDITERMLVLEKIKHLAAIVHSSIDAIIGKDLTGKITSWNKGAENIFGYSEDEMVGHSIMQLIPEDHQNEETQILDRIKQGNRVQDFETVRLAKSGQLIHVSITVSPIRDTLGKIVGASKVVRDITDRIKADEEIRKLNETLENRVIERTGQLNAANKELEAFSYSVSHDLRAPLRAINGYTKILTEDYENLLDEEGKRICDIISSSATQMGLLIDNLLSFSRIGRSSLHPEMLDMKSIVDSVIEENVDINDKERIRFTISTLHQSFGDVNLFHVVWNNLVSNAIKYSSKEVVSKISIDSNQNGNMITYCISDNGAGFDMQYVHKLFGVFQRLHSESEFPGTGVGLAIVERIISRHGGRVWAEAEVGKGARFYFSLPAENLWQ
jgi:PAS domain S-box-containing protein